MTNLESHLPQDGETLASYIKRCRGKMKMSQAEMAQRVGINLQSLGKIESGKTRRLNSKTKAGLSKVLNIPEEYLDAVCRGVPIVQMQSPKICPQCWTPGGDPEPMWLEPRAKYCFLCGTPLIDRCPHCHELIPSLKFRFCGYCGQPYKQ